MDALKRAEHAKQQGQADSISAVHAPDLALDPVTVTPTEPSSTSPRTTLPELPKLEDLDPEFLAHTRRTSAPGTPTAASRRVGFSATETAAERDAIKNAFAVKVGTGVNKDFVLIAAAVGLLAVGVIGAYFWFQLKPTQGIAGLAPMAANDTGLRPDVIVPPSAAEEVRADSQTFSAAVAPAPPAKALAPVEQRSRTRAPVERRPRLSTPPGGDTPIHVTKSFPGVDPAVAEGYQRLQAGDAEAARTAYIRALRTDPNNADALYGMAAIALHQGKTDEAASAYQRILSANPGDAAAEAALVGLNTQGDPVAAESRLKSLLAAQGDQPAVYFALGNLYARQGRWNEAQQANFKAVTADASNPDYLFNLAVSLDQLHQPKLAAQYYEQASAAAESRSAAFDRGQAARRMRELQR
jgi:Tfp pilus assembly protein PilF